MSYVYCNYALYIQSIDDVVFFELNTPQRLYYKDMSDPNSPIVILAFDPKTGFAKIPKPSSIKVTIMNGFYKVNFIFK